MLYLSFEVKLTELDAVAVLYYLLSRLYRSVSVELQRLDSVSRSPLLTHFTESMSGRVSLRAYHQTTRFTRMYFAFIDKNTRALSTLQIASQWLAMRLDFLGALFLFFTALLLVNGNYGAVAGCTSTPLSLSLFIFSFISLATSFSSSPSLLFVFSSLSFLASHDPSLSAVMTNAAYAGLAVSQGLQLQMFINRIANQFADVETKLNGIERIEGTFTFFSFTALICRSICRCFCFYLMNRCCIPSHRASPLQSIPCYPRKRPQ